MKNRVFCLRSVTSAINAPNVFLATSFPMIEYFSLEDSENVKCSKKQFREFGRFVTKTAGKL